MKILDKTVGAILSIFYILVACLAFVSCDGNIEVANKNKPFDLQGHRGARGNRPENTLPAFKYGIEQKMTSLELDTVVTKDDQLIIFHDTRLNGKLCLDTAGQPAKQISISDLTVKELKTFDCGSLKNEKFPDQVPVPGTRLITLRELFEYVSQLDQKQEIHQKLLFNIELKFPKNPSPKDFKKSAALIVQSIEAAGLVDRVTVQSFAIDVLPVVKKLNPGIKTSALFQPTKTQGIQLYGGLSANSDEILERTIAVKADIISPYYLYIKSDFVAAAHTAKIEVLPWTVNDEDTMVKMMNLGVDGIISDYPARLYRVHKKWVQSLK